MVGQVSLKRQVWIVALLATAMLAYAAPAHADERASLEMCKVVTDTAAEAARSGDMEAVRRSKPALERCAIIQREALNKGVQRHLDQQRDAAKTGR